MNKSEKPPINMSVTSKLQNLKPTWSAPIFNRISMGIPFRPNSTGNLAICAGIRGPRWAGQTCKGNQGCSLKNRVTPMCCNKRRKSTLVHILFHIFHVKTRACIFFGEMWLFNFSNRFLKRYFCWKTKWRTRTSSSVQMKVLFRIPESEHVMSSWWLESWVGVRSNNSPTSTWKYDLNHKAKVHWKQVCTLESTHRCIHKQQKRHWTEPTLKRSEPYLGGGFKYFLFSSLPGEDSHFD